MDTTTTTTHILVFPYPANRHMLPLLHLTSHLALRGLTITILVTPNNLPILSPILSAHPSIKTLVLPFPSHEKLAPGVEHIRDIGYSGNPLLMAALPGLAAPIAHWFHSHPSPPHAILSDFFLGWTVQLAHQLCIPRIAFYSSGSFLNSVITTLFSDVDAFKDLDPVQLTDLPRSPVFKKEHLPTMFKAYNDRDPDFRALKDGMLANLSSWGFVFNSFPALESNYLDFFKKFTTRVYGVGPLSVFDEQPADTDSKVLRWLEDCPDESVLYIAFGSQKLLTEPQLQALSLALEKSRTRFVWVVRSGAETQLEEFEKRVGGRGYVVKGWAPQVEILGHRAVGGFLSHCGWNSTLESVLSGVMVLAWPMVADQYINARLLVEDMGVAVRACEGSDTVPDPDELCRVIEEVMGQDHAPQKHRARQLKDKAAAAAITPLDEFVNQLSQIGK